MNKSILGWQKLPLDSFCERVRRNSNKEIRDVLTISSTQGWVDQKKKWARNMAGKSIEKYVLLRRGEFSYNKGNSKTYPQGCVFRLDKWDEALVPNVYHSFSINSELVNSDFLQHFFASGGLNNQLRAVITSSVRNNGLLNITAEEFFKKEVNLPPLHEQKKIAEILSGIDDLVSLYKKKIISLQNLMNAHLSDDHFGNGELIDMSNACSVVADCLHKTPVFTSSGFPIVRTTNVRDGELTYEDMKYVTPQSYKEWTLREKPSYGDILFTREAPLGEACIVPKGINVCIGQRMMLLRPNPEVITPDFLLYKIYSRAVQNVLFKIAGGSTVGHVNVKDVRSLQIKVPDLKLQLKATNRYNSIKKLMDRESNLIFKLVQVKKTLSSDLLSGRKRVVIFKDAKLMRGFQA